MSTDWEAHERTPDSWDPCWRPSPRSQTAGVGVGRATVPPIFSPASAAVSGTPPPACTRPPISAAQLTAAPRRPPPRGSSARRPGPLRPPRAPPPAPSASPQNLATRPSARNPERRLLEEGQGVRVPALLKGGGRRAAEFLCISSDAPGKRRNRNSDVTQESSLKWPRRSSAECSLQERWEARGLASR